MFVKETQTEAQAPESSPTDTSSKPHGPMSGVRGRRSVALGSALDTKKKTQHGALAQGVCAMRSVEGNKKSPHKHDASAPFQHAMKCLTVPGATRNEESNKSASSAIRSKEPVQILLDFSILCRPWTLAN